MNVTRTLIDLIQAVSQDVLAEADSLNRLDGIAGDGDLGITMSNAARALQALAPELEGQSIEAALKRCGLELARKAPSTAGTLLATAFLRAATEANQEPTGVEGAVPRLARLLAAAQRGIQERGKASPGDRTLLDALAPAVAALQDPALAANDVAGGLESAASAAAAGAEATKSMQAKVGRAGWLAERAAGNEDAGAHLVALLFRSAAKHVAR